VQGWVANTHSDWFDFLARKRVWEEVNFWTPSDYYAFHGLPGAPFFFRLKSPRNAIGGFGYVASFSRLPDWLAWECFGEGNGASNFTQMKTRLDTIREQNALKGRDGTGQIGCIVLSDAVFFRPDEWVRQPTDWGKQNLRYKGYDLLTGEGLRVWAECRERAETSSEVSSLVERDPVAAERYGTPVLVRPRLGQGAFRVIVTDAYDRCCAVTGEHSLPVLEAAHIRPFGQDGPHDITNGLLLRSDLHRLFDTGYVTVTADLRMQVSARLRDDYSNGRSYYPFDGQAIRVPSTLAQRPDPLLLRWHNDAVYRG
jgi:putative restriction endonuclease